MRDRVSAKRSASLFESATATASAARLRPDAVRATRAGFGAASMAREGERHASLMRVQVLFRNLISN
ncbi:hypothetical protein AQ475_07475 [Burkholderia thailandensis]|nr:hypothetical protein AQ475_07475 [Burkholderia thailandensis]